MKDERTEIFSTKKADQPAMDLSIIIVNFNTKDDLRRCLLSIYKARGNIRLHVIVVDNNSEDGSQSTIQGEFPWVMLIRNTENKGFVAANNQGIRNANGRYILLLNPDTILFDDTLLKSIEYMDANPQVGCLGIRSLTAKGNIVPNGSRFPSELKAIARLLLFKEIFSHVGQRFLSAYVDKEQEREVDMVGGFYLFLRAESVKQVGELDEAYWADIEDSDYCYRLKKSGWKIMYWPGTSIVHLIGRTIERRIFSLDTFLRVNENIMLFFRKHYSSWRFVFLRILYCVLFIPQILIALMLPVFLGFEKAKPLTRIKGSFLLTKSAAILPERIK